MTLEQQLAQSVALAIKAALMPVQLQMAELKAAVSGTVAKDAWDQLQGTVTALHHRVAAEEARALVAGPAGQPGRDGVDGKDGAAGLNGKDGLDGKDGAAGLHGKDGARGENGANGLDGKHGARGNDGNPGADGKDGARGEDGQPGADGLAGKDGRDGIDGEAGEPGLAGKDGRDGIDGKTGEPGLNGKDGRHGLDGEAGADGSNGKDGIGLAGALLTKDGHLAVTLSDGTVRELGSVRGDAGHDGLNGKDGADGLDGKDGRDGMPGVPGRPGDHGTDGKDGLDGKTGAAGLNGKDGKDGLGFDDLQLLFEDHKGWMLQFSRGTERKTFPVPIPFDAGIWQSGRLYPKGAGVTVKGAFWIAQRDTKARPGDDTTESRAWRLSVKGGQDGKPGPPGKDAAA